MCHDIDVSPSNARLYASFWWKSSLDCLRPQSKPFQWLWNSPRIYIPELCYLRWCCYSQQAATLHPEYMEYHKDDRSRSLRQCMLPRIGISSKNTVLQISDDKLETVIANKWLFGKEIFSSTKPLLSVLPVNCVSQGSVLGHLSYYWL